MLGERETEEEEKIWVFQAHKASVTSKNLNVNQTRAFLLHKKYEEGNNIHWDLHIWDQLIYFAFFK